MITARITALTFAGLLVGCGSDPKPPPTAPTGGNETGAVAPSPQNPKPSDNPTRSDINISDEIRKACGITDAEAFFAFDSASVRPQDRAVFSKLAKCFTDGPLKGREMRLVGHADNRGEEEYNMVLGEKRASNVKTAVVAEGMKTDKCATTSRGELDSTGTDEASWAKDRRVDVVLGD
jgi:peptidoglycan-associated lipoprotein